MKHSARLSAFTATLLALSVANVVNADKLHLSDLDLSVGVFQEWGTPHKDKSVGNKTLTIGGKTFAKGIGTHARSRMVITTDGKADRLTAFVGFDDEIKDDSNAKNERIFFEVIGDGKSLWKSPLLQPGQAPIPVDVPLKGVTKVVLLVGTARDINYCHANWADAVVEYSGAAPVLWTPPPEKMEILTPKAKEEPRINGAKTFGVRPGKPVMFKIPASGVKPITYAAEGLPEGVSLDPSTGILSGRVAEAGTYSLKLTATNAKGTATGALKLVVGDMISLTPPLGWNSWNCFAGDVSADKIKAAADAMVSSGLIDHGWTYINIDDCWQLKGSTPLDQRRDTNGTVLTNDRFPDMKALADYIHSKGLKAGLYSSPGYTTCANYTGSYKFEEKDAQTYAAWGYDYLKHDWCSYGAIASEIRKQPNRPSEHEVFVHPYRVMGDALLKQDRDILYSLCQYGMGHVSEWGGSVHGNAWRTTGDIVDSWQSMAGIGFSQANLAPFAKPGNWNDPDMLVVGWVGWGPKLRQTRLTYNEQYTHITLWSMLASPLLIGCDMTKLDDFTLGLLTNDEVIAVNQDSLGKQATRVKSTPGAEGDLEVWVKDLEDGSKAVAFFNRSDEPAKITISWKELGLEGPQNVRDLWRQQDIGVENDGFSSDVLRHGTRMVRVWKK